MTKLPIILLMLFSTLVHAQDNSTDSTTGNNGDNVQTQNVATSTTSTTDDGNQNVNNNKKNVALPMFPIVYNTSFRNYESNLPNELKPWFNWYQSRYKKECPNNNECVFVSEIVLNGQDSKIQNKSQSSTLHFEMKGYSFTQNQTLVLPHTQNNMPYEVALKGERAKLNQSQNMPLIVLPQGEFDIQGNLNTEGEDLWVGSSAIIDDKRNIATKLDGLYLKNLDNQHQNGQNSSAQAENSFQVQTFRTLSADVPEKLRTVIRVISPKTQTIDLGSVLPSQFLVSQITSNQKIDLVKKNGENHYYLWANSGVNYIDISAFSLEPLVDINLSHLVNEEAQEFWSFNNNVRSFKTDSFTSIDSTRVEVPPSLANSIKSLYQMKLDEPIHIAYNDEIHPPQNITVERDLYKVSHESHFIFKDNLNLDVLEPSFYASNYDIRAIKGDRGNLIILKNSQNLEGFYPNTKHNEVAGLTEEYANLGIEHANYSQVRVHLPPRYRLLATFGAYSPTSYVGQFTLYTLFALFFIVIATYKLFNWKIALIATISILGFAQSTVFIWFFWFSLLFIVGLMTRLDKEGNLHKILRGLALFSILVMSLNVAYFTVYETQKIFNPMMDLAQDSLNINMARLNGNNLAIEAVAPEKNAINAPRMAKAEDGQSYSMPAAAPAPMLSSVNVNIPQKPNVELSNEKKSLFIDNWDTLNSLSLNYELYNINNHFTLIYATSFWVNLMGIIQIITIWLMLFVFSYKITHYFYQINYGEKYYKMLTKWGKTHA